MSNIKIKVSGMTCGGCVKSITNALKSLDSSAFVEVNLPDQTIIVKSSRTSAEILNAVSEAGFPVINSSVQ